MKLNNLSGSQGFILKALFPLDYIERLDIMEIEKVYAIDTMGKYPVAFIQYKGFCPQWQQYQNDKQIQEYINTHSNYVINDPYYKY